MSVCQRDFQNDVFIGLEVLLFDFRPQAVRPRPEIEFSQIACNESGLFHRTNHIDRHGEILHRFSQTNRLTINRNALFDVKRRCCYVLNFNRSGSLNRERENAGFELVASLTLYNAGVGAAAHFLFQRNASLFFRYRNSVDHRSFNIQSVSGNRNAFRQRENQIARQLNPVGIVKRHRNFRLADESGNANRRLVAGQFNRLEIFHTRRRNENRRGFNNREFRFKNVLSKHRHSNQRHHGGDKITVHNNTSCIKDSEEIIAKYKS